MSKGLEAHTASAEALRGEVVDEYLERLGRGERPDVEEYARRHPPLAAALRQMLPALRAVHLPDADPPAAVIVPEGPLGDFRIVRELARGAIARVYLATEASTGGRLVVLKCSLYGDAEARTMGRLAHPHVVPILSARLD